MSRREMWLMRQEMRRILRNLDARWVRAASTEICDRLTDLLQLREERTISHVLVWIPHFMGEVDLTPFINQQLESCKVYLPRTEHDETLSFFSLHKDWQRDLETGKYGIPVLPQGVGEPYDPMTVAQTAMILPGLAFDQRGMRLGRRGAHYERWIRRNHMGEALKVGVCWSLQVFPKVPADDLSTSVDWLVHEEGCVRTGLASLDEVEDFEE